VTFRARQFLTFEGGTIPRSNPTDAHFHTRVMRGQRLLVTLARADVYEPTFWPIGIIGFDAATDTLSRQRYSFAAGTPVSRVLDPAEWTCTADAPVRGDCPLPDGGVGDASSD